MMEAQRHESFYGTGTFIDEPLGVYVGWTVLKDSFSDGMPLCNEQGDVSLVFSGEEYPDSGTVGRLKERAHSFDTGGSSYLVHLYEEDSAYPVGLNGMFHGLLADRARGTAMLFNDRYGMHRLHYHESNDSFYFASEAKAILAVRPELRTVDPRSLGEFVACSCVLENRTIFKGIHVLPGASVWRFRGGTIHDKKTYFQPSDWEQQTPLEPESYYQELRNVLTRNLPRYFVGTQPAIALTGGLDTRVILACHRPMPGSLPSYTFGGMFRDSQDVMIARQVARECQQPYQVITIGDEFLAKFAQYAERSVYLTEGGADVYRASDLYVSEKAREIAPVKIVGTYGSEIIRQSVMFEPVATASGLFRHDLLSYIEQAGTTYRHRSVGHPVTVAAFRQSPWYHHGILALEQSQLTVRSPFLDNDFVRTAYRAPRPGIENGDIRLRLIGEGNPAIARIRSDRGVGGNGHIPKALSRGFQEFTFKAEYAYDYGMPHWLARIDHTFSALHFERLFLGRHKSLHFRVWYRDVLSKYVQQILLDSRTLSRPYLERKGVEAVVQGHIKGGRNFTTEIHKLLTLELLHRKFFDSK
jgi:asparagine synthase (glutamine-hydrolysing)